ncbi:MAG TPA: aminotransferase class III-fold pyridoxal phosphate-dependent enzyme [Chloroflexota bacterium]|jgi:taurine--2-oxoglutarate transaminase|nr:aminotransferase class III-fold pyridoxal phosphate-dependent enzyme [Chloroflexota bacterium]
MLVQLQERSAVDEVVENDRRYVLHSWSTQSAITPLPVAGAEGRYFWDYSGKRYLDFASQLINSNIGHQHPRVVAAIKEQAERLCFVAPSFANDKRGELARLLAAVTPGDLEVSFFTNGGAEANENAIKMARAYTGKHKIIARYRSYHGATAGAITMTGDPRRWPAEPGIPGVVRVLDPYQYRCQFCKPGTCNLRCADQVEEVIQYEGAQTIAAMILETVTGTNGIIPPPPGYLPRVREILNQHKILLIADEVMCGFGRTGRWFACEHWDVTPDLLTLAKGINSGYVPLGAVVLSRPIAEWYQDRPFWGGLTYSGHPLACAAAVATIEAYRDEGIVENAARQGAFLKGALSALQERHPSIGEVRGLGLFWGLELVKDRATREPLVPFNAAGPALGPVSALQKRAMDLGLFLFTHWNVVVIAPPLTITEAELREGLAVLDQCLALADAEVR